MQSAGKGKKRVQKVSDSESSSEEESGDSGDDMEFVNVKQDKNFNALDSTEKKEEVGAGAG